MEKITKILGSVGLALFVFGLFNYLTGGVWDVLTKITFFSGIALCVVFSVFNFKEIKQNFNRRFAQHLSNAIIASVLVLALLAMLNFVSNKRNYRIDLTENQQYTLSQQTVKVLENLDEDVDITSFFRSANSSMAEDLFTEYQYHSSRIVFQNVDPDKKPGIAKNYGVTKYQTIILESKGKTEVIEKLDEQTLTNALIKVSRDGRKTVYYVTGHGEHDVEDQDRLGASKVKQLIEEQNYEFKTFELAREKSIPEDCSVLIINGPTSELFPFELDAVETHINGGGKVLFLIDPQPSPAMSGFFDKFGVTAGNDLVIDASGIGQLFGMGPNVPLITNYGAHTIVSDFNQNTFFPGSRSISIQDSLPENITAEWLLQTTDNSWGETEFYNAPKQEEGVAVSFDETKDLKGPINLGVVVTKKTETVDSTGTTETNGALVVFGDSDFASNAYAEPRNTALFMNAVNWLAEEEDLVAVPPKSPTDRRIDMTAKEAKTVMYLSMVFMPALFIISGVMVYIKRRKL